MNELLNECIENFGEAPRHFSWWDRLTYFRLPKPAWLRANPNDDLMHFFNEYQTVLAEGSVVWGYVIQANHQLFDDGPQDHPGEIVYSLADTQSVTPAYLASLAAELGSLKGTEPDDAALAPIADYLTDEYIRVFGLMVPSMLSPTIRCRISTVYFIRKHLPDRRLCRPLLPIVVGPKKPYVAMVLPERYWPDELIDWWGE